MARIRRGLSLSQKATSGRCQMRRFVFPLMIAAGLLTGCASEPQGPSVRLVPATFDGLVGWKEGAHGGALTAFRQTCALFLRRPDDRSVGPDGLAGTIADWRSACEASQAVAEGDAAARQFFESAFRPFAVQAGDGPSGLFTGYFEPELVGRRTRDAVFTVPVYRRPSDLVMVDLGQFRDSFKGERIAGRVIDGRLRPFEDRAEIDAGALAGRGLEIAWVHDPVALFFLHIQGSGRIALEDGSILRIGYDGHNGHSYVAIGRVLVAEGALDRESVSLQSIRGWLQANPDRAAEIMARNPSYIFFRELTDAGPLGAMGVALTPGHSLAIDRRFMPLGAPVWLDAEDPLDASRRLRRLMVAQDTGGAIRGPVRGDVFWGPGTEAEERAGRMKSRGRYWLLLPMTVAERRGHALPAISAGIGVRLGSLSLRF